MSKIAYINKDNWSQFSYKFRYLDALASLLHVQTDVDATIEYQDQVYLSYNKDLTNQNKKYVSFIQDTILSNLNNYSKDHVLGIYLTFNMDFIKLVKKTRNHVDEECLDLLVKFIESYNKTNGFIEKNFKKIKSPEELSSSIDNIVDNYKNILGYLLEKNQDYHLNTFLRPLQDSYKLHEFLTQEYMYKNLVVIDNPKGLHADTNIVDFFKSSEYLDKNYVGVSKLCCGYCHKYLEERNYKHRGTHGVCDQEWKMDSPLEEKFKFYTKEILELNQLNPPQQHRRLSFDYFEKDILIGPDQTLCKLKCDLLGSNNYDIADEYGYYVFTDHGYVQIN